MNTYISLLRGINVSGQKKIKMLELKSLYQSLQLNNVITYIQSGNVVFQSSLAANAVQVLIENAIKQHFDFDVPVLILTIEQLTTAAGNLPFTAIDIEQEGSKVILFFLSQSSSVVQNDVIKTYLTNSEQIIFTGDIIYLYCPYGLGKSKITTKLIETKLKLTATARNIKTVHKLLSLAID